MKLAGEVAHWHGIPLDRRADELPSLQEWNLLQAQTFWTSFPSQVPRKWTFFYKTQCGRRIQGLLHQLYNLKGSKAGLESFSKVDQRLLSVAVSGRLEGTFPGRVVHLAPSLPTGGAWVVLFTGSGRPCLFSTIAQQRRKKVKANGPALVCVSWEFNYTSHGKVGSLLCVAALSLLGFH